MNTESTAQLISIIRNSQALFPWKAFQKPQRLTDRDKVRTFCEDIIKAFMWLIKLMGDDERKPDFGKVHSFPETFKPFLEGVARNNPTNQEPFKRYEIETIFAELSEAITNEAAPVVKRTLAKRLAEQLHNAIEGREPNGLSVIRRDLDDESQMRLQDKLEELAASGVISDDECQIAQGLVYKHLMDLNNEIYYLQEYWRTYLADIMQQGEASTTAKEPTVTPSESVSGNDGITIKAEEQKPSEGQQETQEQEAEPKGIDDEDLLRLFGQNKELLKEYLLYCKANNPQHMAIKFQSYKEGVQNTNAGYRYTKKTLFDSLVKYGYIVEIKETKKKTKKETKKKTKKKTKKPNECTYNSFKRYKE